MVAIAAGLRERRDGSALIQAQDKIVAAVDRRIMGRPLEPVDRALESERADLLKPGQSARIEKRRSAAGEMSSLQLYRQSGPATPLAAPGRRDARADRRTRA
jgi:hypothetical protein